VRGDYASDRATRNRRDALAIRLQDLAGGSLEPAGAGEPNSAHARRPAEVFARNVDWFVAVSLAAEGRMNGYLSSVQDDILTGYGTVRPPDITGTAGTALVSILDQVAPLYPATREWFLKSYGVDRSLTPYDLARRVLEAATERPNDVPRFDVAGLMSVEAPPSRPTTATWKWHVAASSSKAPRRAPAVSRCSARRKSLGLQACRGCGGNCTDLSGPVRPWTALWSVFSARSHNVHARSAKSMTSSPRRASRSPSRPLAADTASWSGTRILATDLLATRYTPGTFAPQMTLWSWTW
jgi:hypothetical protein